jgi:hypothetical protein
LHPRGEHFGDGLHDAVLERIGPEQGGVVSGLSFWEEDKEGPVDPCEIDRAIVERSEDLENVRRNQFPKGGEERGAKPVGARAREFVHREEGTLDLIA